MENGGYGLLHLQGGLDPPPGNRLDRAVFHRSGRVGRQQQPVEEVVGDIIFYVVENFIIGTRDMDFRRQLRLSAHEDPPRPILIHANREADDLSCAQIAYHGPPRDWSGLSLWSNGVTYSSIDQKTGASPTTLPTASA